MNKVNIVMYHFVRDLANSRYPEIKGLTIKQFEEQVEFLTSNFNIIRTEELIDAIENGGKLPHKPALLTFDDGYIDHYTNVFPILSKYNVQGSFFVPGSVLNENRVLDVNKVHFAFASSTPEQMYEDMIGYLDYYRGNEFVYPNNKELIAKYCKPNRYDAGEIVFVKRMLQSALPEELRHIIANEMYTKYVGISEEKFAKELYITKEQLHVMKKCGMHIGLHGYEHYWLGEVDKNTAAKDIDNALDCMDGLIDKASWTMNYPYGSYNDDVIDIVKSRGCKIGFSVDVDALALDSNINNVKYTIPRLDTNDFPPKSSRYIDYNE